MAPTVCLSELPEPRRPVVPFLRRLRRVSNGAITKQQRLELRRIELNAADREVASLTPPDSPLWEAACPHDSYAPTIVSSSFPIVSARVPAGIEQQWKVFLIRRKGLLDLVVRTMALVRRNNILQEKVTALREEIREFIDSVSNNPENKCMQQKQDTDRKDMDVSSSTEKAVSRPSPPSTPDSTCSSSSNDVTSTCDGSKRNRKRSADDNDES